MGLTDFTPEPTRRAHHAHPRPEPDPRAGRRRRADLPGAATGLRGRALADRPAARLPDRRPAPRGGRIRGPRPGPQDRGPGDPGRPRRAEKGGYRGSSLSCPACREPARFVAYRGRTVVSLLGPIRVTRAYYHCPHCHGGTAPADATLRLTDAALTPGACEAACLAGALSSFAEAAEVALPRLAGLRLGE